MQKVNKNRLNSGLDFSIQVKNGLTILLYHGVTEKNIIKDYVIDKENIFI
jgi:hypothetical protein